MVELWSYHTLGFDLILDQIDWSKSQFYNLNPHIRAAYHRLRELVGTDQLIWCVTDPTHWPEVIEEKRWHLMVPRDAIFRIVNSYAWERLILPPEAKATEIPLPPAMRKRLRPEDPAGIDINDKIRKVQHEMQARCSHEEEWGNLFLDDLSEDSTVLLKHPIQEDWVLGTEIRPPRKLS